MAAASVFLLRVARLPRLHGGAQILGAAGPATSISRRRMHRRLPQDRWWQAGISLHRLPFRHWCARRRQRGLHGSYHIPAGSARSACLCHPARSEFPSDRSGIPKVRPQEADICRQPAGLDCRMPSTEGIPAAERATQVRGSEQNLPGRSADLRLPQGLPRRTRLMHRATASVD